MVVIAHGVLEQADSTAATRAAGVLRMLPSARTTTRVLRVPVTTTKVRGDSIQVQVTTEGQPAGETSSAEKSKPQAIPKEPSQPRVKPDETGGPTGPSGPKSPATTGSSRSTKTALGWIGGATALSALITLWSYLSKEDKMLGLIPPPAVQGPGVAATTFGAAVCLAGFFSYNSPTDVSSSGSNGGRPINQILS